MENKRIKVEVEIDQELYDLIEFKRIDCSFLDWNFSDVLNMVLYEGQAGIFEAQQYYSEKLNKEYKDKAHKLYRMVADKAKEKQQKK